MAARRCRRGESPVPQPTLRSRGEDSARRSSRAYVYHVATYQVRMPRRSLFIRHIKDCYPIADSAHDVPNPLRAMKQLGEGNPELAGIVRRREREALLFEHGLAAQNP